MFSKALQVLTLSTLMVSSLSFAITQEQKDYLTIDSIEIEEVSVGVANTKGRDAYQETHSVNNAGEVIAVAREFVALGEDIYNLIQKAKPVVKTSYSPISVMPKVNGVAVDILDTEGWKAPIKATYQITYKNLFGMEVVKFRYSVMFSYGGSYKKKGAYLTAAQIIPEQVSVMPLFEVNATMKLVGLQNFGTVANPIAGAILQIEYTVTGLNSDTNVVSYQLTGKGGFKQL